MPKITFIGAGSTVFARNLLGDILSYPELAESTIALHDIDPERLRTTQVVAGRIAVALGVHPTIEATLDRRAALDGADYAISMFQVAGYKPGTVIDFEIPKKYGLRQTIADTLGIGGIMRGLRTIPVLLAMCRDMEELCPDVTFLQYVNPMAINMRLYWELLKLAIERRCAAFDFGRCTRNAGTYRFKAQWGAQPVQLYWHAKEMASADWSNNILDDRSKLEAAVKLWTRLPLAVANRLGPHISSRLPW